MPIEQIKSIGIIRTPFTEIEDMPIQPKGAVGIAGEVYVFEEFAPGLADLDGFSHIYLIYVFHQAGRTALQVTPFLDSKKHGVFATRSPLRPNHIGMSIVKLENIQDNIITVSGIDVLDQTPLLDIKPYIERFDKVNNSSSGWMQADQKQIAAKRSDDRFK